MSRKIEKERLKKLRTLLKQHPEGLWIRELSRMSGIGKSTVSRYINIHMRDELEIKKIGRVVKIVKLKR